MVANTTGWQPTRESGLLPGVGIDSNAEPQAEASS